MDTNKKFWDRTAKLYGPIQEKSNRLLYEHVSRCCLPYLHPDTRVLELACGSGQLTIPLHSRAGHWEATDFSEKMIAETQTRCPDVTVSVQDATALNYPSKSFDVVLIANALHIMPNTDAAMAEIRRVLTDDGIVIAPTFVYEGTVNRFRMWITTMIGFRTFHEWTLKELADYVENAGFSVIQQELLPGSPLPEGFVAARKMP